MTYLYGDSTESGLEVNYIHLLRDVVDAAVEILLSVQAVRDSERRRHERHTIADVELEQLADLERAVTLVLQAKGRGDAATPIGRCAAAVGRALAGAVATESTAIGKAMTEDLGLVDADAARERLAYVRTLESLLQRHDLPQCTRLVRVQLVDGARYQARLLESALGLEMVLALDIPGDHLFAQPLRVERIIEHLDISTPEKRGWFHKAVNPSLQKLSKLYVVEVAAGATETTIRLRTAPTGDDSGFDMVLAAAGEPRLTMTRAGRVDDSAASFVPQEEDADKLLAFHNPLAAAVATLDRRRGKLVEATLDGRPLSEHENPGLLVERLVGAMAPVVAEIAAHSPVAGELVLKRVLGDDSRQETFISRADLERRLARLPPDLRSPFAPLGLAPAAPARTGPSRADDDEDTGVRPASGPFPLPPELVAPLPGDPAAPDPVDDQWLEGPDGSPAPPRAKKAAARPPTPPARKPTSPSRPD